MLCWMLGEEFYSGRELCLFKTSLNGPFESDWRLCGECLSGSALSRSNRAVEESQEVRAEEKNRKGEKNQGGQTCGVGSKHRGMETPCQVES